MEQDDKNGGSLHNNGKLLGCAISATTFVSNLKETYLKRYKHKDHTPTCSVCFQFSNREDMHNFVPDAGYQPFHHLGNKKATTTKCFDGKASITGRFANWQKADDRFQGFGYPWTVDCALANGIKELTCREISRMQQDISERDDIQSISFNTKIVLASRFDGRPKPFHVHTTWPWAAVASHDDDRSKIAEALPKAWNDVDSPFVPKNAQELRLAHVEGPGYDKTEYEGEVSLKSMNQDVTSTGGVHPRLLSNLFHLIRNAPGSTHIMAIVDGQVNRSHRHILDLLNTKMSVLYPKYGQLVFDDIEELKKSDLIPITKMGEKGGSMDMTLMVVLRLRRIKIHIVPITTPSMAFEKSVAGGQYSFAPYLAARFAADYQVMMFIDGDTAMVEGSAETLQHTLYERFFSDNSSKCAGHRLRLIEQYVKPHDQNTERVLQCTHELLSNPKKWDYAIKNCNLKEGHIVARTDSIYAFSVHHPDTLSAYVPPGVQDCITPDNKESDRYFLKDSEFVQLHLRDRERKAECTCFADGPK